MILITLLSTLISSAFGQSRFILANYTLPDFEGDVTSGDLVDSLTPFPIGSCVIYRAELDLSFDTVLVTKNVVVTYYGKFECTTTSTTDDTVEFTDYGTDSTCMTQDNTNDHTYYPKAEAGTEGDFSCSGSDNYVSIQAWITSGIGEDNGGAACCDGYVDRLGVVTSTFATGVCFDSGNGYYSMGGCNATQTTAAIFSDSACTQEATPTADESSFSIGLIDATSDYCQLLGSDATVFEISLYGIMSECYSDGNEEDMDDYCPYVAPSEQPTTAAPTTADPTMNPTKPTAAPTVELDDKANVSYFVGKLIILVMGIAIYMN